MPQLNVLICGGGVGGPALAFWLARAGHKVTIVERFSALRAAGAQIDLRAQGIKAVKRMGLMDDVRRILVDEPGSMIVDKHGRVRGVVNANKSGKGAQSATSEFEIMRGDLVRLLHDKTKDNVNYIFGKTVDRFEQDDKNVTAYFSDGTSGTYDILVGADGQGSRIRKAILPKDSPEPFRRLGFYVAYWMVPRIETDNEYCKKYWAPSRWVMSRSHNAKETQAYCFLKDTSERYRYIPKAPVQEQKDFFTQKFMNAGWESRRFIDGLKDTDNFYCQEVVQVVTDTWSRGRVVLLGDAAHCPSPMTGMGTTSAFVGAYVLAGEIAKNSEDIPKAFSEYDKKLRPFADSFQAVNIKLRQRMFPESEWAIALMLIIVQIVVFLRIPDLFVKYIAKEDKGGWQLPDYPEMDLSLGQTSAKRSNDLKDKAGNQS